VIAGFGSEVRGEVFVGKLRGTRAYVGIHVQGRRVRVYVCDGSSRGITIDEWFSGRLGRNRRVPSLQSKVNHLRQQGTATLTGALAANRRSFRGRVTLRDGRTVSFTVRRARRSAFFAYRLVNGEFRSGLVQLPDGSDRGTSYPPYVRCRTTARAAATPCLD
jgi:hypothetical protein